MGTSIAQGACAYATAAIVSVTATPPGGGEALVLPDLIRQSGVADQSERNGDDAASEDSSRDPLHHFCEGNRQEGRPKVENEDAQGDGHDAGRDQQAFRSNRIEKLAGRGLADQARDASRAEDEPDVLGCPRLCRQVGGRNRTKPGLQAGQKEVEPVQGKLAAPRRCGGASYAHIGTLVLHSAASRTTPIGGQDDAFEILQPNIMVNDRLAFAWT
jgi:hypothetical protein